MRDAMKGSGDMDKKKVIKFTALALGMSWLIQIVVCLIARNVEGYAGTLAFQVGMMVVMFTPLIASIIAKTGVKSIGWKPRLKGNVKWIFFAIFMPVVFTALGCAIFFVFWPDLFSLDGSYMLKAVEATGVDPAEYVQALEQQGLSMQTMMLITLLQCVTYAPFVNMFLAVGEESGWRGFLYPELKKRFGRVTTWIIGGAIWAAFHFPAMLLVGYEYGTDYIGAPVLGLVTFTITCIVWGMFHEIVYDKTKCIWIAALLHGSINAGSTLFQLVLNAEHEEEIARLLVFGPAPHGLISVIPTLIIAVIMAVIVLKEDKKKVLAA